jgi:thiosulfate/3-mercaptopyruvate sulfurtransferase
MKRASRTAFIVASILILITGIMPVMAQSHSGSIAAPEIATISASDLAATLRGSGPKPLILQVGPQRLYRYAHIPGAEYVGAASEPAGIEALRKRVQGMKRTAAIVIYCGCCPWQHCPNIQPAYDELRKLGFRNARALYLPNNFKTDWDDKGYPTEKAGS